MMISLYQLNLMQRFHAATSVPFKELTVHILCLRQCGGVPVRHI